MSSQGRRSPQVNMTTSYNTAEESIPCCVDYNRFQSLWTNLSYTVEHTDEAAECILLHYTDHAISFEEFREKYPTITIETSGIAISQCTFGDVGRGKFGTLTYNTQNFFIDHFGHSVLVVDASDSRLGAYSVSTKIGLRFKKRGTKLILSPFISGHLKSHGGVRYLDFGLKVDKLTFHPVRRQKGSLSNMSSPRERDPRANMTVYNTTDESIRCCIDYQNFQSLWTHLSYTVEHTDDAVEYILLDYRNYANSSEEFREKYPTVAIETSGIAISQCTFGNVGKAKFGTLTYSTQNFFTDHFGYSVFMVDASNGWHGAYSVSTKIGLSFKTKATELILSPFITGHLKSHGGVRYLDFGLKVGKITFNPATETKRCYKTPGENCSAENIGTREYNPNLNSSRMPKFIWIILLVSALFIALASIFSLICSQKDDNNEAQPSSVGFKDWLIPFRKACEKYCIITIKVEL